jgi:hypothetical protein
MAGAGLRQPCPASLLTVSEIDSSASAALDTKIADSGSNQIVCWRQSFACEPSAFTFNAKQPMSLSTSSTRSVWPTTATNTSLTSGGNRGRRAARR